MKSTVDRFHDFHNDVGMLAEQLTWIVNSLSGDEPPAAGLLDRAISELHQLLDANSNIYTYGADDPRPGEELQP